MSVAAFALISALALAGSGTAPPPSAPATPMWMPAAHLYDEVAVPDTTFDAPLAAVQHFARYNPGADGPTKMDLISLNHGGPDSLVMYFFVDGYADDSVAGEQWRIVLDRAPGGWRVSMAGRQVKCHRGANAGKWQRGLCS